MNAVVLCRVIVTSCAVGIATCGYSQESQTYPASEIGVVEGESVKENRDLLEWTNGVHRKGFELRKSAKQNKYLIAVFRSHEGDLVFCRQSLGESAKVSSLDVSDNSGKSLISPGVGVRPLIRKHVVARQRGSVNVSVHEGEIVSIGEVRDRIIRIRFSVSENGSDAESRKERVVFDEVIEW